MLAKPASLELQRYPFDWSRIRVINVSEKESHLDGLTKLSELVSSVQEMVSVLQDAFKKLIAVSSTHLTHSQYNPIRVTDATYLA